MGRMGSSTGEGVNGRQKAMLAALAVVLIALVYFLFLRGGDAPKDQLAQPVAQDPIAQAPPNDDPFEPEGGEADQKAPVETFEVFASRDPFEPVIENGNAGNEQGTPIDQDGVADPPADADPPASQDPAAQANDQEVEGHKVTLIDVFREEGKDRAEVQVDTTGYTVDEGEVFAENFQLVSTSGTCATLLYGDDQFTLCEGEEILK